MKWHLVRRRGGVGEEELKNQLLEMKDAMMYVALNEYVGPATDVEGAGPSRSGGGGKFRSDLKKCYRKSENVRDWNCSANAYLYMFEVCTHRFISFLFTVADEALSRRASSVSPLFRNFTAISRFHRQDRTFHCARQPMG